MLLLLTPWGPVAQLARHLMRCHNLLWRLVFLQTFIERKLALEFWQSMSTLNELIGYVVLTDCREIWPEDSRNNDKQKGVREF